MEIRDQSPINTAQLKAIRPTRLRRLLETSTTLSSILDHNQIIELVVTSASDLTESEIASLYLVDPTTENIELASSTLPNLPDNYEEPSLDDSLYGWILGNKLPVVLQNVEQDIHEYSSVNPTDPSNAGSLMAVPLLTKDSVIGVLEVKNKLGEGYFTEQDSVLLQMLASHGAAALENVRLFQQTDLIAEFMHEFKTPLMALTTASEILAREDLVPFHQELLLMIQSETARMSRMAQDFLDLSRLESGRLQFDQKPVDLNRIAEDVVKLQKAQADKQEVILSIEVLGEVPGITGDYDRLVQVLINLTSNAIKYNRHGGRVKIRILQLGDEVALKVMDTGPGIDEKNLPHLFERYYRVKDNEGFTEGAGLGLPIAKRIVENHGGRIEVSSMIGGGSTFSCFFPIGDSPEQTLASIDTETKTEQ